MALRAGRLNRRVILQTASRAADGGGGSTLTWVDTATVWAAITPLQGTERFQAQQVSATLTTELEIRYRAGVVAQQRFLFGARAFYIAQPPVNPDSANERLVCLCEERNVGLAPAATSLARWVAGDVMPGELFTRASIATFIDANGIFRTALTGVKRDAHYVGGVRTLLLESGSENLCVRSEEFDTWQKNPNIVVTANAATAPDGTSTAELIDIPLALSNAALRSNNLIFTGDGEKCAAVFLKAGTAATTAVGILDNTLNTWRHLLKVVWSSGIPTVTTFQGSGTIYPVEYHFASGMWRIAFSIAGIIAGDLHNFYLYPSGTSAAAGSVYAWGAQPENQPVPSSYIPTGAAEVTRAVDAYIIPGVVAGGSPRLYQRYFDLATAAWVDSDTAYTSGASIVPVVNRALAGLGVFAQAMTTAQYRSVLGI